MDGVTGVRGAGEGEKARLGSGVVWGSRLVHCDSVH